MDEKKLIEYLEDMQKYCIRCEKQSYEPEEIERYKGQVIFIADLLLKIDRSEFT